MIPPEPLYPRGTAARLLASEAVTQTTREALEARLARPLVAAPQFFSANELWTLRAVFARLIPQPERPVPIDVAGFVDERLAQNEGNGWRYDLLPPDGEMLRHLISALDERAQERYGDYFARLEKAEQNALLEEMQNSGTEVEVRAFEELLSEAVEHFYAHPLAQDEIGYAGYADAPGWTRIGLGEREEREPGAVSEQEPDSEEKSETEDVSPRFVSSSFLALSPAMNAKHEEEFDAVIIGTGAGGAPLLARLAQAGLRVLALEAGPHYDPAHDFPTDEKAQAKLFWRDERLSAGSDPLAFGANNSGIGVGGSTLHYTAYTPRVQPDDLRLYSEFGVGCDWPLEFQELEPYYDELEAFLGVSGPSSYPWGPPRKTSYPLSPLPLNGAAQLMQRGCHALGIRTSPAPNAALSAPYYQSGVGWRRACTNRGFCQAGCSTGAKASMDVTFVPLALSHGAQIWPGCFVTRIETKSGRVTGVIYTCEGREERVKCKNLFLCAGAIETPRLLLLNELGNASGQVGRNFMAHTGMQLWGQFEEVVRPFKGIPGSLISEDMHRPKDADFAGGYLLQSIGVMPVTYASQLARGQRALGAALWGDELREHMRAYNHTAGINILGEGLPSAGNFLEMSDETDARGLPKPRIHFSAGDNEHRLHAHARKMMGAIFDAAGVGAAWTFERFAHTLGTCRMGYDAAQSVVNPHGRSFEVPNLWVCDGSVFPSSLSANPALTIMALSLRTADHFLQQNARGEL
ncbi:fructose dehydrogenase large subunit [Abditibacteriota bacterium]|nr:fructose dehydrogenase large subunit [Abditibacteriota bacterium]